MAFGGHIAEQQYCPLYPQKQTFVAAIGMSALCQKRTLRGAPRGPTLMLRVADNAA